MKSAMKSGDKSRLGVIRMLLSEVKNVDLMPGQPSPEQAIAAYAKKLRKSLEEYDKLGKKPQADQLRAEIAIVDEYLPQRASADDTARLVDEFLARNSFTDKQFGQAMGAFMKEHGQQVDPQAANQLLRQRLAKG
jgi:uncharacterized protein YqeY